MKAPDGQPSALAQKGDGCGNWGASPQPPVPQHLTSHPGPPVYRPQPPRSRPPRKGLCTRLRGADVPPAQAGGGCPHQLLSHSSETGGAPSALTLPEAAQATGRWACLPPHTWAGGSAHFQAALPAREPAGERLCLHARLCLPPRSVTGSDPGLPCGTAQALPR